MEDGAAKQLYQMILVDWNIVEIEGIEQVKKIHEFVWDTMAILFLVDHDAKGIEEVSQMQNTGILTKPFLATAFQQKIMEMQAQRDGKEQMEGTDMDNLEGLHLLAAEDNEINAEILSEILSMEGATCEIAENGQLVLERFKNSKEGEFDAILMDVQMPIMNGYEATRAIRALARRIPIIAMTANAFAEDEKEALEAGMNVHLAKPIDIELLNKVISQCVSKKGK